MDEHAVLQAYARLKALRANAPEPHVPAKYVGEFHAILDLLTGSTGVNLAAFHVPGEELRRIVTGGNWVTGTQDFSADVYCEAPYFLMKLDGVLTMFEVLLAPSPGPGKPRIGFKP